MADFRRWFTVLAVLALMVGAASAQIGSATGGGVGSAAGALQCSAVAAGTPQLRPEGYTELVGDIVITCTGGPPQTVGNTVPLTNITVSIFPSVPLTSRLLTNEGANASEALLLIDEPTSGIVTGATGAYGPNAPQVGCTVTSETNSAGSLCPQYVGVDGSGNYQVTVNAKGGTTAGANVYQGQLGPSGSSSTYNQVTFFAVPVLPPATIGVSRVLRITNIRIPVVSAGLGLNSQFTAVINASPSTALPLQSSTIVVGEVGKPMTAAVTKTPPTPGFTQCVGRSVTKAATISFTEGFATSFKTRVVPGGSANPQPNVQYEAEGTNLPALQAVPGGLYNQFSQNSESGLIFSQFANGAITAGLADYGTRLKAVFYNIPAGITLYVSTVAQGAVPVAIGGNVVSPYAVLVGTSLSTDATSDATAFPPIVPTTTGSDGLAAIALPQNATNGAVAVWEVTNSNPSAIDTMSFSVYIGYTPAAATAANPYGLPVTGLPLGVNAPDIQMSFAPEPSDGTFTPAQGPTPLTFAIPRFAVISTQELQNWLTINLCQTTLLYPFVTGQAGFDTGIAVANTSKDPWGTINQAGSCTLYGYGVAVPTSGSGAPTPTAPIIYGCDNSAQVANPVPGTNCFGGPQANQLYISAGEVSSVSAATLLPNFQGYVIAICNFQFAHGYAAVTDLGLHYIFSSYLALELNNAPLGAGSRGTSNGGVQGIESLIH